MVGAKQFAIMRKIIEDKEINPIVKSITLPKHMQDHEKETKRYAGSFLDRFNTDSWAKEVRKEKPKTENKKEFSDELINRLTYEVFQNIKRYLDKSPNHNENPTGSKHIKLEINF